MQRALDTSRALAALAWSLCALAAPGAAQNPHAAPHGPPAAGASLWDHWRVGRAFRRAEEQASESVERMRAAERSGDAVAWAAAARAGAALRPGSEAEAGAQLAAPERAVVERFLASLVVHDHGGT